MAISTIDFFRGLGGTTNIEPKEVFNFSGNVGEEPTEVINDFGTGIFQIIGDEGLTLPITILEDTKSTKGILINEMDNQYNEVIYQAVQELNNDGLGVFKITKQVKGINPETGNVETSDIEYLPIFKIIKVA